ncbi:MAG TPA: SPOR domain-containing protein [Steroidobacteraceae bacterium]
MRTLIVSLIFANLAFAAWVLLIDRPVAAPAAHDISHLPKLVLVGELAPRTASVSAGAHHAASNGGGTPGNGAAAAGHCVTVGPFSDLVFAAAADALLQTRGFKPTQRDEPGADLVEYWVYLDNVPSDAAATRLLQQLHSSGLADAHVMPVATPTDPRRVSVGLFNERTGAERRARQVKALGLTPVITEQHQPEATYWVDINLTSPEQTVSTQGLLPPAAGAHLEIRDCPAAASSAPAPARRRS